MMFELPVIEFEPIDVGGVMDAPTLPDAWQDWFRAADPAMKEFAPHHEEAGEWLQLIERGKRSREFVSIWARGHGKSTFAETGAAFFGETGRRSFVLYVCSTQDAADKHVANIGTILERIGGDIGKRLENEYGHSKGWKKSMIRTKVGFSVLGLGLDVAMRGIKLDNLRPDLIIFDDIDERHDTAATTKKKIETLTESILPAGSSDCIVWGVQNLIIPNGIFAQLADGRADFMATRFVSGPIPAVLGLETEERYVESWTWPSGETVEVEKKTHVITGGVPTWSGCDLTVCQAEIFKFGFKAFKREKQHEVGDVEGALLTSEQISRVTREYALSVITRSVVGVDPATTSKKSSDDTGIIGAGRDADGHGYVTDDETGRYTPAQWGRRAVLLHDRIGADRIVAESNQGGEMVQSVIETAAKELHEEGERDSPDVVVVLVHASKGKRARAEPIAQLYEEHKVHHVDTGLTALEGEWTTWDASDGSESPNRIDATVWALTDLVDAEMQLFFG